jgi:hypothetical protein
MSAMTLNPIVDTDLLRRAGLIAFTEPRISTPAKKRGRSHKKKPIPLVNTMDLRKLLDGRLPGETLYEAGKRLGYKPEQVFKIRKRWLQMQGRSYAA